MNAGDKISAEVTRLRAEQRDAERDLLQREEEALEALKSFLPRANELVNYLRRCGYGQFFKLSTGRVKRSGEFRDNVPMLDAWPCVQIFYYQGYYRAILCSHDHQANPEFTYGKFNLKEQEDLASKIEANLPLIIFREECRREEAAKSYFSSGEQWRFPTYAGLLLFVIFMIASNCQRF